MCKIMLLNLEGKKLFADDADNKSTVDVGSSKQWLYWLLSDELLNLGATFVTSSFKFDDAKAGIVFGAPLWSGDDTILTLTDTHIGTNSRGEWSYTLEITVSGTSYRAIKRIQGPGRITTSNPTIRNH